MTTVKSSLCLLIIGLLVSVGCVASYNDKVISARRAYYSGNLELAGKQFETRLKKNNKKEQDLVKLENAMVDMSNGNFREAKKALLEVRNSFDELERKNLAEDTLSLWTDDTFVSYGGEDYEKVMIRVFLALCDLMLDGSDAEAFALQVVEKQNQIVLAAEDKKAKTEEEKQKNPKLAYKQVPFGSYLRGVIREESLVDYDDAARYYTQVVQWEPNFQQGQIDLERAIKQQHHAEGNGVVYVFTMVGRGPYKERENAEATQLALLVADQIFSATNKYTLPPTLAPVPIPAIRRHFDPIHSVGVYVEGTPCAKTETITNIGLMAEEQFEAIKHQVIARAIVRRVVKKGSVYATKNIADVNPWISLAMDAGGVAWEAMETADTRCWGVLPDRIQVARIELPEGKHRLQLQPLSGNGFPLNSRKHSVEVNVKNGYNCYILANFPSSELVGQVHVSNH